MRLQITVFCQLIGFTALSADNLRSLPLHPAFRPAAGTLIQHPVQTVCPERLSHPDLIFLLPSEIIEGKLLLQNIV